MTEIDVHEITRPMREAAARFTAEAERVEAQAVEIEQAAQQHATQILRKAGEDAAPLRRNAAKLRAHAERFGVLIAREEHEAAAGRIPDDTLVVSGESLTETLVDGLPEQEVRP